MPLTVAQLRKEGLLDVLATTFDNEPQAQMLLDDVDFPAARRPSFTGAGNPLGFWRQVATEIANGVVPGGLEALLSAAASHYPHNQQLGRWAEGPPPGPQGALGPAATVPAPPAAAPAPPPAVAPTAGTPKGKRKLKVFLNHIHEDKPQVRHYCDRLATDGFEPWLDERELLAGQAWRPTISRAVRDSDVVIVFLSQFSAQKKGFGQKEIRLALDVLDEQPEDAIFLIPARLEKCDVPDRLSRQQYVDLFATDGYDRLKRALLARAQDLGL